MLFQSETLKITWIEENIAELLFSSPRTVNVLNKETLLSLNEGLAVLEQQSELQGLILRSCKSSFILGADINEFLPLFSSPEQDLLEWLQTTNTIFNRLEDLPVPTVSCINGYALGGGCECVLATDYRIAASNAQLGLPETKLGIIPGFGGTVRLPRLIGADNAIALITSGKELNANEALKMGLVDAVVDTEKLPDAALSLLHQVIAGKFTWLAQRKNKLNPLKLSKTEALMCFSTAQASVQQRAGKHYPAPLSAVEAIANSAFLSRNEALKIEHAAFAPLARSATARALVGIFLSKQHVKSIAKQRQQHVEPPAKAAVLGAGIMGGGIAYQSALKGTPIIMKDIAAHALELGMNEATNLLNQQQEKGRIGAQQITQILMRIHPTLSYTEIDNADIVIEAVVENPAIKSSLLAEVESLLKPDAVIASNTSTIPISLLAKVLQRPENFCGMHFFNPVHRMPLVEIIRGAKTSEKTIARVVAYATQMGKTPIVVNDCAGFFVNRVLFPYFTAFTLLLRDGAHFAHIDHIMETQFGWPMGPAHLLDIVGIDTAHHAQTFMAASYPDRMQKIDNNAIDLLFNQKRYGQKNGLGFYRYLLNSKGKPQKIIDEDVVATITAVNAPAKTFSDDEIIARMMIPMINEVVRCLEEKVIASPAEADLALIYGIGFPPFRGGALRYLDSLGVRNFAESSRPYQNISELYQLPSSLQEKAKNSENYYPY